MLNVSKPKWVSFEISTFHSESVFLYVNCNFFIKKPSKNMKLILTSLVLAVSLVGANAKESVHKVVIKGIEAEIQQTPEFQVNGIKEKKFNPRHWLEIEAELEVQTTNDKGEADPSGFIPEITANWFVIIKDKESGKPMMLTGKVTFREIRTKDKKAYLSAYISPDTLEKLTGENKPSDKDIEGVALVISGPGILSEDKEHKKGLQKATVHEDTQWWNTSLYKKLDGAVLAKSKTPFAPLWTDRYPVEKPEL
jgi:hypothetical protein